MRRLILIRHCQATGQRPDDPLTAEGEKQAETLKDFLSGLGIDRILASEYRRAQQSAAPLAAALGLEVGRDRRLNERELSAHPVENWRDILRDSFDDPDLRGPGGESARDALDRAREVLNGLLNSDSRLTAAASHGNLISLVLNSIDPTFGYEGWESLTNPDVFMLTDPGDGTLRFRRMWR